MFNIGKLIDKADPNKGFALNFFRLFFMFLLRLNFFYHDVNILSLNAHH